MKDEEGLGRKTASSKRVRETTTRYGNSSRTGGETSQKNPRQSTIRYPAGIRGESCSASACLCWPAATPSIRDAQGESGSTSFCMSSSQMRKWNMLWLNRKKPVTFMQEVLFMQTIIRTISSSIESLGHQFHIVNIT